MVRAVQKVISVNLFVAALLVLAWLGYGAWRGLPVGDTFLGFQRDTRAGTPAWLLPVLVQGAVLCAFGVRRRFDEGMIRLGIAALAAMYLAFGLVLPVLMQQVDDTPMDVHQRWAWWYVCFADISYAVVGSGDNAAATKKKEVL